MILTEQHRIHHSHPQYKLLWDCCKLAKNLYNHATYIVRQKFIFNSYWVRYNELDKLLKLDTKYPDYRNMPTAASAQQLLRKVDKTWKSFFAAIKDWKQHPDKYLGRPKLPKYCQRAVTMIELTNQQCKIKQNKLTFPKVFQGLQLPLRFTQKDYKKLCTVRVVPHNRDIIIEVVYEVADTTALPDNHRYMGIDLGVNNLVAWVTSITSPGLVNGRPLKSMNQYYNKKLAAMKSNLPAKQYISNQIRQLTNKRNRKVKDYLHKVSKYLVEICKQQQIRTIIIGKNDGWKQHSNMSKRVNQNFVEIPYNQLIQMISYKAAQIGVTIILTEESYTSGTSYLDGELPIRANYNRKRRVKRGLFISNSGKEINADINAAYQMIKKVVPNSNEWDRGCGVHPVSWIPN